MSALQWLDGVEDLGRDAHLAAGIGERRAGRDRNDLDEVWPRRERRHCVLGNLCRTLRAHRDRECESIELRRGIRRDGEIRVCPDQPDDSGEASLALVDGARRVLDHVRERCAQVAQLIGKVGIAELPGRDGRIRDGRRSRNDDIDRDLDGLGHRRRGWAERRRDGGVERAGERSRGVGRQRDHFCRRFADGQRHRTKRNAIAAFGKAERFCHEKLEGGNLQDNVRFPLALNERYLCRAHRTLAGLQADHAESAATTNEAIEMRDVDPFRGKAFGNLDGLSIPVVSINQASLFKFIQISEIWPKCA